MFGRKVRIAPHHLRTLPSAQLLQCMQRRAMLHMPARPGVPQVVPAEVLDARALQRAVPSLRADLTNRPPAKTEHVGFMVPDPAADDEHGLRIERHRNRLPRLRLIRMNPRQPPHQIHLRPPVSYTHLTLPTISS